MIKEEVEVYVEGGVRQDIKMVNFLQDLKKYSIVNSLLITHFPSPHCAYLEVQVTLHIIVLPMFVINSTNLVKVHLMLILQAVK